MPEQPNIAEAFDELMFELEREVQLAREGSTDPQQTSEGRAYCLAHADKRSPLVKRLKECRDLILSIDSERPLFR